METLVLELISKYTKETERVLVCFVNNSSSLYVESSFKNNVVEMHSSFEVNRE